MKVHKHIFDRLIAPEHMFRSWEEFRKGKGSRKDVQDFEWNLEQNILSLCRDPRERTYKHGQYSAFTICDPKQRRIHKASVRDRVLHHAVFSILNPIFEPTFIAHSFSCRVGKGTHRAVTALEKWLRQVSRNYRYPCFALKCDIHQFFASVDHEVLLAILSRKVKDRDAMQLLTEIVGSFSNSPGNERPKGIPIGNLTSQLFANVYLNEFDQFMKHTLRIRHYIRYTDDFVIVDSVSEDMSLGYDVLSFTPDGKEKHIEVKGTKVQNGGAFFLTANELARSKEVPNYFLYVVTGVGSDHVRIHYLSGPDFQSNHFQLQPTGYRVRYLPLA